MERQHNILSKKILLAEAVTEGQIVSFDGHLATTGDKEPAGVALYEGKKGEIIAVMSIGIIDVKTDASLELGDFVKATAGKVAKASNKAEAFAQVSEVNSASSVEIMIK